MPRRVAMPPVLGMPYGLPGSEMPIQTPSEAFRRVSAEEIRAALLAGGQFLPPDEILLPDRAAFLRLLPPRPVSPAPPPRIDIVTADFAAVEARVAGREATK